MTDGMIYHGVRKQELLKIIERSGLNFEEATSNFGFADNTRNPLSLILDGYFIQIIPMAREEHITTRQKLLLSECTQFSSNKNLDCDLVTGSLTLAIRVCLAFTLQYHHLKQ
ncbi:hypothetical protein [Klebsiella pneumoniae]|uniref:hypothetical protein n=1 Tax=Klebsiella pneumoniae TaxID=573 RepID=UPI00350ECF48